MKDKTLTVKVAGESKFKAQRMGTNTNIVLDVTIKGYCATLKIPFADFSPDDLAIEELVKRLNKGIKR